MNAPTPAMPPARLLPIGDGTRVRIGRWMMGAAAVVTGIGIVMIAAFGGWSYFVEEGVYRPAVFAFGFGALVWMMLAVQPSNGAVWALAWSAVCAALWVVGETAVAWETRGPLDIDDIELLAPADFPLVSALGMSLYIWPGALSIFLPLTFGILLFPDGRLPSPRWRWVAWASVASLALIVLPLIWLGNPTSRYPYDAAEGFARQLWTVAIFGFVASIAIAWLGLPALIVRSRRGDQGTRRQVRLMFTGFVGFGLLATGAAVAGGLVSSIDIEALERLLMLAGQLILLASFAVAILRYRLYDVDIVISKAVTYGTLAVFIGAVYVGIVVGIGELLGQGDRVSFTLSIIATVVVAMAFQPVRRWVERRANRLVFGKRATPYEVLATFSRRASEEPDEKALARIPRLIVDGTSAAAAALWTRSGDGFRTAFTWPEEEAIRRIGGGSDEFADPDADYSVPVHHDDELLGAISLVQERGVAITPAEEHLLEGVAGAMGLTLRNAQLTARLRRQVEDLERSRDRIVLAADDARRSLEHDLDSGPQQQLVALKVKLGPVRRMAEQAGAEKTAQVVAQLEDAAGEAIRAVRDFAAGIYPPLLEAEGLAVAIGQQAKKAAVPVTLEVDGVGRYPREVEAAVYFTVLEAFQNITKYAHATATTVTMEVADGELTFAVRDDGVGFDPARVPSGAGLANMADRLDAVGGRCTISSAPGKGTTVGGAVPLREREPAGA